MSEAAKESDRECMKDWRRRTTMPTSRCGSEATGGLPRKPSARLKWVAQSEALRLQAAVFGGTASSATAAAVEKMSGTV